MISKSLANRVTLIVLVVIVGITLIFNLGRAYFDLLNELNANIERVDQAAFNSAPLIAGAIDQNNLLMISQIVEGLMLNKTIEALIVEDANGSILFERVVQEPLARTPIVSFLLPKNSFDQSIALFSTPEMSATKAEAVGRLHLTINQQRGLSGFAERSRQLFWIGVLRTFLTLIVLVLSLRYLLILPLRQVVLGLQSASAEEQGLGIPQGHEADEIGLLVHGINQSLGRQRLQMAQIEENEQRLKSILDGAGDACVLFAQGEGEIVYANDAATELLGYTQEELLTLGVFDISPSLDRTEWFERVRIVSKIRAHQRESILISKNGDEIPVESTSSSIDLEGRRLLLSFIRDMSGRKRLEMNLAHAQKLTSLGELTGGVAHDFNNLLQLIQGAIDTIKGSSDLASAQVKSSLAIAERASEQGADLIGQLLAFAKKQDLDPQVINLFEAVRRNLPLLEQAAGEKVSINFNSNLERILTRLDISALNSALLNLIVNARHAMPEGGNVNLALNAVSTKDIASFLPDELKGKQVVVLSVRDDGEGMSEAVVQRVFEPFYTTKTKGTGMGLAMVFGFVAQSGGHIRVESVLGFGPTFFIYLPVAEATTSELLSEPEVERPAVGSPHFRGLSQKRSSDGETRASVPINQSQSALKKNRVLLVDDHDDVRFITKSYLEAEGYSTIDVASPQEAQRALMDESKPVDILISDLRIPEQRDGLHFIALCKRDFPNLKLAITSGDLRELTRRGEVLPANVPVLSKPFTRSKLAELLKEMSTKF